ncbi:MAG: hypothetical protein UY62_C0030G0008 [Parcubacteria group bacterium GW2011_GWF2_50_9]|nr:MAG: hypothetical protein UY62_C0030G0008 [Parcubacteria group bacterium GW2011_GWF2_50_9]
MNKIIVLFILSVVGLTSFANDQIMEVSQAVSSASVNEFFSGQMEKIEEKVFPLPISRGNKEIILINIGTAAKISSVDANITHPGKVVSSKEKTPAINTGAIVGDIFPQEKSQGLNPGVGTPAPTLLIKEEPRLKENSPDNDYGLGAFRLARIPSVVYPLLLLQLFWLLSLEIRSRKVKIPNTSAGGKPLAPSLVRQPSMVIPQLVLSRQVIQALIKGTNSFRGTNPNVETGYALVGKRQVIGGVRQIVITGIIDAGPKSIKLPCFLQVDRPFQQRELEIMQCVDPEVEYLGDFHLHPGSMDHCSSGDRDTDRANAMESSSKELLFGIATVQANQPGSQVQGIDSGGLKLNWYYLGKASAYEYVEVRATVENMPCMQYSQSFRAYALSDLKRVALDIQILRSITGTKASFLYSDNEGRQHFILTMEHLYRPGKVLVEFSQETPGEVKFYFEKSGRIFEAVAVGNSPYYNGWLTPVVYGMLKDLAIKQ